MPPHAPLVVRQKLAGDHQAKQGAVRPLAVSQICHLMHQQIQRVRDAGLPLSSAMLDSIQMSGLPRPTTWTKAKEEWEPLFLTVVALGEQAATAVKRLEAREPGTAPFHFREMRSLRTPEWQRVGAAGLLDDGMSCARLRTHLVHTAKDQWVDFHWQPGNR